MIKKINLRECFENFIERNKRFWCGSSWHAIAGYGIDIIQVGISYCVVLVAYNFNWSAWSSVLRSYPMSYKSAYRLVCSL